MPIADLNQCDKACFGCIKRYKSKHNLKLGQKFKISCDGIPMKQLPLPLLEVIPKQEQVMAQAMLDPVAWAKEALDWHCLDPDGSVWQRKNPEEYYSWKEANPNTSILGKSRYHREYQATMLRCTARRKVFRIGRQAGKCLPSGTLIQMADGTQKPIELISDGDLVASVTDEYKSVVNPAFRACNGEKDVLKIELMDGREIEATYNHPFLSRQRVGRETTGNRRAIFNDEWKPSEELTENDYLAVPKNTRLVISSDNLPDHAMTVLGCLIADGNITGNNCRFSNGNLKILNHFKSAIEKYDCSLKQYECDNSIVDYHVIGQGSGKRHKIKDWLRNLKLQGLDSHNKFIPDFVMRENNQNIKELLRCMFGCDGWAVVCSDDSVEIGYSTVSEKLASQIVSLLARFGVYTTVSHKTVKLNEKKFHSRQLTITRKESIANFRNKIGILGKEENVEKVYKISQAKNPSYKTEAYEDDDVAFIKIRSIRHVGKKMTWDLTVPETHNFIANNIITHNTESLVISILYNMFTKPDVPSSEGFKVVIITPYQTQIDLIFTRLLQLINGSKVMSNAVKRNIKAPTYTLELHNGSVVRGFTAGTKSGGNAESVRGQTAQMLVFDEADYLSSGDVDAALSIITNYPNATVWMSSTPSGKRERFYETCFSKRYKEFHYPSYANPLWNEELEETFREQLTEIGYVHEIEGGFGEQEQGVFQNQYIQTAKADYKYGEMAPHHEWTYTIGVDWNDVKHGTTINVLGFNPRNNLFYIVDRCAVSREGWTQLSACNKIAEYNRVWNPISIYVDKGYGSTQIEVLRKFGYDAVSDPQKGPTHPDSRLRNIIEPYDFGSSIEARDLFTKVPIKKNAKGFLVESTVRRFESNDLRFSEYDKDLEAQLHGYIIDRVTPTGNAVYKASDEKAGDHALDALMLSIVAFVLEVTPLGKPRYETNIAFSGQFGEGKELGNAPGDLIMKSDPKKSSLETRAKSKPQEGRAEVMEPQLSLFPSETQLPAISTTQTETKTWSWKGFFRDEPKPGNSKNSSRRPGRPRRKNI